VVAYVTLGTLESTEKSAAEGTGFWPHKRHYFIGMSNKREAAHKSTNMVDYGQLLFNNCYILQN